MIPLNRPKKFTQVGTGAPTIVCISQNARLHSRFSAPIFQHIFRLASRLKDEAPDDTASWLKAASAFREAESELQ